MAAIADALDQFIRSLPAVTALVGTAIAPSVMPRSEVFPFVTYEQVDLGPIKVLEGPGAAAVPDFHVTAWGKTAKEADDLANALMGSGNYGDTGAVTGLNNFRRGNWGDANHQIWVGFSQVNDRREIFVEPVNAGDQSAWGVELDVTVFYDT